MLLHTHSVMAFILALTAAGMFTHLFRLRQPVNAKGWLMAFYLALFGWQMENVFRYSLPANYADTLVYKLSVVVVLVPCLTLTLVAHTQYVYRFLAHPWPKESRVIQKISVGLFLAEFGYVFWHQFFRTTPQPDWRISAFLLSSIFTLWMISVALRKAFLFLTTEPKIAKAHFYYAAINGCYVIGSTLSAAFGFLTVVGSWSYFMFVWLGNLASIVLYIVAAAVPAGFQTKITGFTFVMAATILCIVTLAIYPPDYAADLSKQVEQHRGLLRLVLITLLVAAMTVVLMPMMLRVSMTMPLQRLLQGVQAVNEGKLNTQVEVGLMDEIGLLTRNFNQMTNSLQQAQGELTGYTHTLEKKVAARTAQLQKSLQDLKTAQAQLIQSEKMASLGELTAGIAHEIKNPLNFMVNFSEVSLDLTLELREEMEKENPDRETVNAILGDIEMNFQKILQHGRRATGIVTSMLVHSRSSKGVKEPTDINDLVETYLRTSYEEMQIRNKGFQASIQRQYDPAVGTMNLIPEDMGRVLLNLFNNAFYALEEKKKALNGTFEPTLQVATKRNETGVELWVKDNGTGIPENVLSKIYQPFFTTKPTGVGTGLGLSLSYDIVTKGHGGSLTVQTPPEGGTAFVIQLPHT
jgi:signal transduction histidine kinase